MNLKPCKSCDTLPKVSDVGGNNAFYEISCLNCEDSFVAYDSDLLKATEIWNKENERHSH